MKNLLEFANVKLAIEQAVSASDVDNGTRGLIFEAVSIKSHTAYQAERVELQKEMVNALREHKLEEYIKLEKAMKELPDPTVFMIWKLLKPLKDLKGTMIRVDKKTRYTLSMSSVDEIWIPSLFMAADGIQGEETGRKWKNPLGGEVPIIKLQMLKGIIDIFAPVQSFKGKEILPKRAMCTLISLRAMQITGELSARQRMDQRRRYGFDAENI
jgi:hypothetical protein